MLKRILLCMLALMLTLSLVCCNKQPEPPTPDPTPPDNEQPGKPEKPTATLYAGNYFGENDALTWKFYTDGKLVIEGEGAFPIFETASEGNSDLPWANYVESILRVEIGAGITALSQYSFKGCSALKTVILPTSVSEIPYRCFEDCIALEEVRGGIGLVTLCEDAFIGCRNLKILSLSAPISNVEYGAFGESACHKGLTIYFTGDEAAWEATRAKLTVGEQNAAFVNAKLQFFPLA